MEKIGLLFTVRARINIANLTPSKAIVDLDSLLSGVPEDKFVDNVYQIARILNNEYEIDRREKQGKEVNVKENYAVITKDDIEAMTNVEFNEFYADIVGVLRGERTVEATPKKGKSQVQKSS